MDDRRTASVPAPYWDLHRLRAGATRDFAGATRVFAVATWAYAVARWVVAGATKLYSGGFLGVVCGIWAAAAVFILPGRVSGQPPTTGPVPTPEAIEQEVLENIRSQPVGIRKVEDLNLPDAFLRRVADRAIRSSYEQRYRIVVPDAASGRGAGPGVGTGGDSASTNGAGFPIWRWAGHAVIATAAILLAGWALRARKEKRS